MFTLTAGLPNSLAPGKRPRTTLTPSMALRDGEPYLAFGTPGGDQQDQWTLTFFLRHVLFGMNLQEAIDAPRFAALPVLVLPRADRRRWRWMWRSGRPLECWLSCAAAGTRSRSGHALVAGPGQRQRDALRGREPPQQEYAKAAERGPALISGVLFAL